MDYCDTYTEIRSFREMPDLKEGTRIGRYQILELIGKGGMGAVYKAYDPELDRSIAIKILTARPHEGETASKPQARLMREAQALAKLSHPNVVSIFDVGTYEESVYIGMEYVKGKTLREWIKDVKPTQHEIINVLSKAGKGLQAAHSEEIVHRDFKPDNIIVGDKGQIKVLDFGLARAAGTEDTAISCEKPKSIQEPASGEQLLSTPLTQVGAQIGTIVYMAPEHFLIEDLDEKTDQFSFSVTLFEAIYGQRPFSGNTLEELDKNVTSGVIELPEGVDVPKWIEEIILKGLSVKKEDRFKSMMELLDALENDPEIANKLRRRKQLLVLTFVLGAALFLGIGYVLFGRPSEMCTGADRKIAIIWNKEQKDEIGRTFNKTGLSYANDSFFRVMKRFDDYFGTWKNEYTETCEATRLRGEQSEQIMDLKMQCLNKHLQEARALLRVFRKANKIVVGKSIQAVSSLSGFSSCNDLKALRSTIPPPKDEQVKTKVKAIRMRLTEIEALEKTGEYSEGLKLAKKLKQEADSVGYLPVEAEVLYQLGNLLGKAGEYKKAEKALFEAANAAGESGDSQLSAKAVTLLVGVVGDNQARLEEGLSLGRVAEVVLRLGGADEMIWARLLNNQGLVFWRKGSHDKALEYYGKAVAIREKAIGSAHPDVASSFGNMGGVFYSQGKYDKALEFYLKALVVHKKVLGPEHPEVATSLNNLGIVYEKQGDYDKSLEYHRGALEIWAKALGSEHPDVAYSLDGIGNVLLRKGAYDKAHEAFRKSLAILEKALGLEHPILAWPLSGIGSVLVSQNRPKLALQPLERAMTICDKKTCDLEPHGLIVSLLARALVATNGGKNRALKLAKQARVVYGKNPTRFRKELEELDAWLKKHDEDKGLSLAKQ